MIIQYDRVMQKSGQCRSAAPFAAAFPAASPGPFLRNAGGDLPAKFQGGLEGLGVFLLIVIETKKRSFQKLSQPGASGRLGRWRRPPFDVVGKDPKASAAEPMSNTSSTMAACALFE